MQRRHARRADLIEDIAAGYGGCQGKEGRKAMDACIKALRRG